MTSEQASQVVTSLDDISLSLSDILATSQWSLLVLGFLLGVVIAGFIAVLVIKGLKF